MPGILTNVGVPGIFVLVGQRHDATGKATIMYTTNAATWNKVWFECFTKMITVYNEDHGMDDMQRIARATAGQAWGAQLTIALDSTIVRGFAAARGVHSDGV